MIKKISYEKAKNIVKERMPFGGFWLKRKGKFIGIENASGDAQIEVFKDAKTCFKWLRV